MIRIGIPKETADTRVSMVPQLVEKFMAQTGAELWIEKGAGEAALFPDAAYEEAGAKIADRQEVLSQSDVVLTFSPLPESDWKQLSANTIMVSRFAPYLDDTIAGKVAEAGLRGYSLDMIPRTTLAQSMDVLSSLASIAGYRAVLEAAMHLPRYFPMMITAAGSIRPAQILILGAGVAGLQAIATAKRLGAAVEASDTRLAAKEEVESLGGRFVMVEGAKDEKDAGGYAVKQDEDFLRRQREEVQKRAVKADVIITTAQVRGHKAPLLVPAETIEQMKPGSVIVDLAASTGGNCAFTENGKVIQHKGITIVGDSDLSRKQPQDASFLFANNLLNFLKLMIKEGAFVEEEHEILVASRLGA